MITNISNNRMVYGVTLDVTPTYQSYVDAGGSRKKGVFYVADGNGGAAQSRVVYVYDEIACCIISYVSLHNSAIYDITGVCNPGGRDIFLSSNYEQLDGRVLKESILYQTTADSQGAFSFKSISGVSGECAIWANISPDLLQMSTITLECTVVNTTTDPVLIYDSFISSNEGLAECSCCKGKKTLTSGDACTYCGGDGIRENIEKCPTCGGIGSTNGVSCTECSGDGLVNETCNVCQGTKQIPVIICPTCDNTGKLSNGTQCPDCGGKGTLSTYICPVCNGSGSVPHIYAVPMFTASGTCPNDVTDIFATVFKNEEGATLPLDDDITLDMLRQAHSTSATAENGSFKIQLTDSNFGVIPEGSKCVIWTTTAVPDGVLAISSVSVSQTPCLSGDTMITVSLDRSKRLDNLKIGDAVMAGNGALTTVRLLKRGLFNHCHTLYKFEDGTVIDETHTHRFYNSDQGFWQRLENWNIGDHALRQDGRPVALVDKEYIEEEVEMFGIWTDSGDYYANGLLSGDVSRNKPLLESATAEQAVDMLLSATEYQVTKLFGLEGVLP